jgi:DNA-binding FrmR family transcriptional regulator
MEASKQEALKRMKSISGHVKGIERMLENDAYCIDVIKQVQAVCSACHKVTRTFVSVISSTSAASDTLMFSYAMSTSTSR